MSEPKSTTIERCPFCGFNAQLIFNGPTKDQVQHTISWGQDVDGGMWFVQCDACGANTGEAYTEDGATEFWNRRAS